MSGCLQTDRELWILYAFKTVLFWGAGQVCRHSWRSCLSLLPLEKMWQFLCSGAIGMVGPTVWPKRLHSLQPDVSNCVGQNYCGGPIWLHSNTMFRDNRQDMWFRGRIFACQFRWFFILGDHSFWYSIFFYIALLLSPPKRALYVTMYHFRYGSNYLRFSVRFKDKATQGNSCNAMQVKFEV